VSDWNRTTQEIPFASLPPEMVTAIYRYTEQYNLGRILSDVLISIQTSSTKIKKGLFGREEMVQMGVVVTPRWLVWAISETKTKPVVLSAQLSDVTVQDYAQTTFAKLITDSGIEVSGMFTNASERASAFIGLGEGVAGNKFKETLIKAAANAKK
jgi:hypothetical protein